ncbi:MAG: AsmA family protein [Hyphomicrobiales bacterium]
MIRKLALSVGIAFALVIGVVLALPLIVSSQMVRQEVASQISELTGRPVTLRGDQALKMFPNPSVELSDIVVEGNLAGAENALVAAERLRGNVRLLPLLFGRIELSEFVLTRPTIRFIRTAGGEANWALDGSSLLAALEPSREGSGGLQLGTFRLVDGTVHIDDAVRGISETMSSADLSLSWPTSSTRAAIAGSTIWRGELVDISASIDQPAALAQSGSTSGLVVSIASSPLRLRFDGTVSPGTGTSVDGQRNQPWQASGTFDVSTPSARRTVSWLGHEMEAGSTFGAFRLDADINLVGLSADLTDASLSLDGNEADGVLTLNVGDADSRPSVQGTLDFQRLDLSAYLDSLRPTTTAAAPTDWRFMTVPNVFAGGVDMDVRFAARQVLASPVTFGETAGSILVSQDRLVLGIGEAIAYGGLIRGSVTMQAGPAGQESITTSIDLSTDTVQLGPLLSAFQNEPRLLGALTVRAMVAGSGTTLADVMQTLQGNATINVSDGAFPGIDLDQVARSLADASFDLSVLEDGGETEIQSLDVEMTSQDGYLNVSDMQIFTEAAQLSLGGQSNLETRALALSGLAQLIEDGEEPLLEVPFEVRGTWASPIILPDLGGLEDSLPGSENIAP